jgi:hypothetical protein
MITDDDWYNPTIHCSTGTKLPVEESSMPQLSILKKYINKQMRITLPVRYFYENCCTPTFITCGTARLRVPSLSSVVTICVRLHKASLISESLMVGKFGSSGDSKQILVLYQLPISLRNNPLHLPQDGRVVQGTFICYDYQVDSKPAASRQHTRTTAPHATKRRHSTRAAPARRNARRRPSPS